MQKSSNPKQLDSMNTATRVVETTRLHLRKPLTEDFTLLSKLWKNKKVRHFLGGVISDKEIEVKIISVQDHWNQHGFGQFTIYYKITKQIVGLCGLHYSEAGIEISYMFFPEFWGKGLATEATLAVLYYGFSYLKLQKITAITQEANWSSCRLLEKIGMLHTETLERFGAKQRLYVLNSMGAIAPLLSQYGIRVLDETQIDEALDTAKTIKV